AVRGRRPLTSDGESRDGDGAAVLLPSELPARQCSPRQPWPQQRERMGPDGEACRPVIRQHPLPLRLLGQLRRGRGRVERQRELPLLSAGARDRRRPEREAELPEQPPALAETIAGAGGDERLQPIAV